MFRGKSEAVEGVLYERNFFTATQADSERPAARLGLGGSQAAGGEGKRGGQANGSSAQPVAKKAKKGKKAPQDDAVGEPEEAAAPAAEPEPAKEVDKSSKEYTGEDLAAHARAAMKEKTSFSFGFDIQPDEAPQGAGDDGAGGEAQAPQVVGQDSRTVYVGGLPYTVQDVDIEQYFSEYGQVERIDKLTFSDSGRFNGIAFVTFDSGRSAKKALQANGQSFYDEERFLVVRKYHRPAGQGQGQGEGGQGQRHQQPIERTPGYHRVYVGNLPWDCTDEWLREFFQECKIKFLRLGTDKEGQFRGFAHVHFSSDEDMDTALALNGEYMGDRPVKISPAMPPKR